jgi:hypothetical protein
LVKKIIKLSNSTLLGIFKYYVKNAEWYPIYLIQSGVGLDEAVKNREYKFHSFSKVHKIERVPLPIEKKLLQNSLGGH